MNVAKANEFSLPVHNNAPKNRHEAYQKKDSTLVADNIENTDKLEQDTPNYSPAYTKASAKTGGAQNNRTEFGDAHRSVRQMKNDAMKDMVQETLSGQAGGKKSVSYSPISSNSDITSALKAAEATSEGKDYWGVDATAERIFTFAKSLAGEDEELLKTMRDAFETGFKQALGKSGKLPGISYETRDKVNQLFDDYEKSLSEKKQAQTDPTKQTEQADTQEKTENTGGQNNTTPYMGAGKYGNSATTSYTSEKVSYMGPEKYGSSYKK